MINVTTKEELKDAFKNHRSEVIILSGPLAEKVVSIKKSSKKVCIGVGCAMIAIGVAAIPFSGGASGAAVAAGLAHATAAGGAAVTFTLTAGQVYILIVGGIGLTGFALWKNYTIEVYVDENGVPHIKFTPKN